VDLEVVDLADREASPAVLIQMTFSVSFLVVGLEDERRQDLAPIRSELWQERTFKHR
jgi:hypothetical protein